MINSHIRKNAKRKFDKGDELSNELHIAARRNIYPDEISAGLLIDDVMAGPFMDISRESPLMQNVAALQANLLADDSDQHGFLTDRLRSGKMRSSLKYKHPTQFAEKLRDQESRVAEKGKLKTDLTNALYNFEKYKSTRDKKSDKSTRDRIPKVVVDDDGEILEQAPSVPETEPGLGKRKRARAE